VRTRWPLRRTVLVTGALLALAWITTIVVLIHRSPEAGAASPAALASAYQQAWSDHDSAALERLLFRPPDRGTVDRLGVDPACDPGPVRVRAVGESHLELSTADGTPCDRLPIAERDGRWYVNPWADPTR